MAHGFNEVSSNQNRETRKSLCSHLGTLLLSMTVKHCSGSNWAWYISFCEVKVLIIGQGRFFF